MIVPRIIRENRINFYVGSTALADERRSGSARLQFNFIWERIDNMEDALTRLPNSHLQLLTGVSLNITNGWANLFSLGHGGIMLVGGYAAAFLTLPLSFKRDLLFGSWPKIHTSAQASSHLHHKGLQPRSQPFFDKDQNPGTAASSSSECLLDRKRNVAVNLISKTCFRLSGPFFHSPPFASRKPTYKKGLGMTFFDLITKGGIIMIPIVVCSICSLAIIIERLLQYRKEKTHLKKLLDKLEPLIIGNKMSEAKVLCEEAAGLIPRLYRAALLELQKNMNFETPLENEISTVQRVIDAELEVNMIPKLEKHLNTLDTLARGTPLLGLLGTVIGMIQVFFSLGLNQSTPDPTVLSKGIALALLTTAAGLIVAIPSFFMHRFFIGKVDQLLEESQKAKRWLIGQLPKRRLLSMPNSHE